MFKAKQHLESLGHKFPSSCIDEDDVDGEADDETRGNDTMNKSIERERQCIESLNVINSKTDTSTKRIVLTDDTEILDSDEEDEHDKEESAKETGNDISECDIVKENLPSHTGKFRPLNINWDWRAQFWPENLPLATMKKKSKRKKKVNLHPVIPDALTEKCRGADCILCGWFAFAKEWTTSEGDKNRVTFGCNPDNCSLGKNWHDWVVVQFDGTDE